jgi:ABC-type transport system involved in multi-copper enzyme maturation permease subunit
MSTGTLPARRDAEAPTGDTGFGAVLRGEWTKFRTVRGWVVGVVVAATVMVGFGIIGAGHAGIGCLGPHGTQLSGKACLPPVVTGPGGEAVTDSYYFVRQPLGAHGSITVRMTSLTGAYGGGGGPGGIQAGQGGLTNPGVQPWSKAGIMIAASTGQGAAYAAIMATGSHGVAMQWNFTQDVAGITGKVTVASPRWLRLTRSGDTVTGYDSADGVHWNRVATAQLAGLASTVPAGMFTTSPPYMQLSSSGRGGNQMAPAVATGVFDHVRLTGGQAGATWAGINVGNQGQFGPGTRNVAAYRQAGGRFTVTGNGDIAPDVVGPAAQLPSTTIENHLIGVFAGLIALIVVAAMFMTIEYRRGLIRLTLAASPRRGRVLAAKAVVVAIVGFATGLVAAVISVLIGVPMDQAQGQYVLSVNWLTEVRVIAGTAALVAVAAVLALALGTLMRRSAAAVTSGIVVIVLPFILGLALPTGAGAWLFRLTPAAGFAIEQSLPAYRQVINSYTVQNGYYPLAWWAGFGVLCLYAAAALGGALFVLRRRDA